jgi:rhomboid family GlyGly-CTERM serine protease
MGLRNDSNSGRVTPIRFLLIWQIPLILGVAGMLAALAGDGGREWLRWDRSAIADGEIWRLVSGHLVHMNWSHFLLNGVGLLLVWMLVGQNMTTRRWLLIIVVTIAGTDLGFWFLDADLQWYVGLSGLLHGLLMAGLVAGLGAARGESILIGLFVISKLVYEQMAGPLPGSESASGGAVIVNAHLYGAISATAFAAILEIRVRTIRTI